MAEGLLKRALRDYPSLSHVKVASAGIAAMPGQGMSYETENILQENDAEIDGFRSQSVDRKLIEEALLVIAMTSSHAAVICQYFPNLCDRVYLMCDFIFEEDLQGADIQDPIGLGDDAYREVAEVMQLAIPGIIETIRNSM